MNQIKQILASLNSTQISGSTQSEHEMDSFFDALNVVTNLTTTTNGAVVHNSSTSACVDFFALGGTNRSQNSQDANSLFIKAFFENKTYAVRLMFMFRDVREGQGLRSSFRSQIKWLAEEYPDETKKLIDLIPEYGRWDDMYAVADTPCESYMFAKYITQITSDLKNLSLDQPISLAGKWLKRINTSSKESVRLGNKTRQAFDLSQKDYRQLCSSLNRHLDVVENKMSANKWENINYSAVPSQCFLKNRNSFARHDSERYRQFILDVSENKAKVNAKTLYPYQIISKILLNTITPNEAQILWDNLTNYPVDDNAIVVADVSGSMTGLPMDVCVSIALYFSERATGPFKDHFITFSSKPKLVKTVGDTIFQKCVNLSRAEWGYNTNLEAVFLLILQTAISHKLQPSAMVKSLYIISDMQFDEAAKAPQSAVETFYDSMRNLFSEHGYTIPKLVFWNVGSSLGVPVVSTTENTVMISGFSPSILKYIVGQSTEIPTPESAMLEVINSPRYASINF